MVKGGTLLNIEKPTPREQWSRGFKMQNELENGLKNLLRCLPPTDPNLKKLKALLAELTELVKTWDVKTTFPEPKTFRNHTRFQVLLADMLSDIGEYEPYLKLFIECFEAENELVALKQPTGGQTVDSQEPRQANVSGKIDAPIHFAVMQLNEEFLEWLLGRPRTDVNQRNSNEETALAILCEKYDECLRLGNQPEDAETQLPQIGKLIKRLLKAGADFNFLNLPIESLLNDDPLLAVTLTKAPKTKRGSEDRADLLACAENLDDTQTIHMSKVDDSGSTPLHLALKYGLESVPNLTPLDYGTYEFWKNYLDRCIEVEADEGNDKRIVRFNLNCFETFAKNRGGGTDTEMTTVRQIAQSKELKPLLIHPVVQTFIMVKWMRLSHWNYLNLVLTVLTAVLFGSFSLTACSHEGPNEILLWGSALTVLLMAFREILQMLFLRKSYMSFDNALDIANIVAMISVLRYGCNGLVSSLVVISLALQMTFLLGSLVLKKLSTVTYMLKTLSTSYLKDFGLFMPIIGAFIYAFYLTYNESPIKRVKRDACTEDDCVEKNFNSFHTFWNATIKTLVMTSGELEASTLDFDEGKLVLFLLFFLVIHIVTWNAFNVLAVSDIAAIREKSELISISKTVMLLEQYERGAANVRPACLNKLFPKPYFAEHHSWIQVRAKSREIEVHRKDESNRPNNTTAFEPLSIVPLLGDGCSNVLLNFRLFKISLFMRLDQSILTEALAIHEKRHPFTRTPLAATVSSTAVASNLSPQRTRSSSVTPTAPIRVNLSANRLFEEQSLMVQYQTIEDLHSFLHG